MTVSKEEAVWFTPPSDCTTACARSRIDEPLCGHAFHCMHPSIASIKNDFCAVDVAMSGTHLHVDGSITGRHLWLLPSSGASPAMKHNLLFGPARLHAAHKTAITGAECPQAITIPPVSCNDDRHSDGDGHAPPPARQARCDRTASVL